MAAKVYKIRNKTHNTWSDGAIPPKFVSVGGQMWRTAKGVKDHILRVKRGYTLYGKGRPAKKQPSWYGKNKTRRYGDKDLADFYNDCEIVTFELHEAKTRNDLNEFLETEVKTALLERIK